MYDTQYPSIVPKSADLVVSYVDGPQASNFDQAQQIFGSKALSITWTGEPADIADVEGGFAMSKLPESIKQQQDAGIPKPVIYAIYSGVGTNYQQVKKAVGSAKVSWWLSDWTGKPHTLPGADAVQYGAQASPSSPMITDPSQPADTRTTCPSSARRSPTTGVRHTSRQRRHPRHQPLMLAVQGAQAQLPPR